MCGQQGEENGKALLSEENLEILFSVSVWMNFKQNFSFFPESNLV